MKSIAAAAASGILLYWSQGLNEAWALSWLAPVPLLWLAYGRAPTWQLLLAAAGAWLAGQFYAFQCYGTVSPLLILSGLLPLTILFPVAVYFARFAQRRAAAALTLLAFPACWTGLEFLYSLIAPNGSFGSLAYSQMSAPVLIQAASLFGMYGVTFLICLVANALAMSLHPSTRAYRLIALALAVFALNLAFGAARLSRPQADVLKVGAFVDESAMLAAYHSDTLESAIGVAATYAGAIEAAAAQGVEFAVTPEGGIVTRREWRAAILAPLMALAERKGLQIIAGVYEREPPADLAFALQSNAAPRSYAKRHLVPFLETDFVPGRDSGWLGEGRAMEICKDMDFPRTINADAKLGIRLAGVPAGDFGKDGWLHARMSIMRGVENGFAIVRAANEGLLTASDAEGRVIARKSATASGMTVLTASVPLGGGATLYTRIGDAFAWSNVFALLAIAGLCMAKRRR